MVVLLEQAPHTAILESISLNFNLKNWRNVKWNQKLILKNTNKIGNFLSKLSKDNKESKIMSYKKKDIIMDMELIKKFNVKHYSNNFKIWRK